MLDAGQWKRGDLSKHSSLALWRSWVSVNGYEIWQGRPFGDSTFVYRLVVPDGTEHDFRLLNEAKGSITGRKATYAELEAEVLRLRSEVENLKRAAI